MSEENTVTEGTASAAGTAHEPAVAVAVVDAGGAAASAATFEEHKHEHPNYMAVFLALLGLTVVEALTPYAPVGHGMQVFLLCGMAAVKAGLVAFYFMHLKFELPNLKLLVVVPLVFAFLLAMGVAWDAMALSGKAAQWMNAPWVK